MIGNVDRSAYPFDSKWMQLGSGRMHYVDEGKGERDPIVFVHGTPTWSFEWRHVIKALSPTHRCIAVDHLGFGLSERPRGAPYTPEWHARNFAEFIEKLDPAPFTLVVHDFGGPIALPLALQRPDLVKRVAIVNSWMWSFAGDKEMESKAWIAGSVFGRFLYRWANLSLKVVAPSAYGDRRKLTPEIHQQYLDRFPDQHSRGEVLWTLARALLESGSFYEMLWQQRSKFSGRPALIIWGMRDSAFKPRQLERWKEALPHARVVRIEDAGHWPHEEAPDEVIAALRAF